MIRGLMRILIVFGIIEFERIKTEEQPFYYFGGIISLQYMRGDQLDLAYEMQHLVELMDIVCVYVFSKLLL